MIEETTNLYTVWMVWGEEASEIQKYEFETEAEVNAFLLGVSESDGWLDSASFRSEAEATAYQKEVFDDEDEQEEDEEEVVEEDDEDDYDEDTTDDIDQEAFGDRGDE